MNIFATFLAALVTTLASVVQAGEPTQVLKYVYFVPKDVSFDQEAYEGVQRAAELFAEWNRGQFGGRAPDYKVDYVFGDHDWKWYIYNFEEFNRLHGTNHNKSMPFMALDMTFFEVRDKLGNPKNDPNLRYYIYMHEFAPWDDTQGTGMEEAGYSWASYEDIQLVYENVPRAYLGPGHEVGHMWGLPHQGPQNDCMMTGFYNEHCDYSEGNKKQILARHSDFFNGHTGKNLGVRDPPASPLKLYEQCSSSITQSTKSCPAGTYCQPHSEDISLCIPKPAKCPIQVTNMDYFGNDIKQVPTYGAPHCCDECTKTPGCKAYVFRAYPTPTCYLKSKAGRGYRAKGVISGIVHE